MRYLLLIITLFLSITAQAQYTVIPDANFEAALDALGYDDISNDGQVPTSLINSIIDLDVGGQSISDLTGIEDFIALEDLDVDTNTLTTINLSTLSNLKSLQGQRNSLITLDVSSNLNLETLALIDNLLTSLDVTNNIKLTNLGVKNNSITTIDLSQNVLLDHLVVANNGMTSLDVTNNTVLRNLYAQDNNILSSLDLTNNTNLEIIAVTNSTSLTYVDARNGNNTNANSFNFSGCTSLTCISVDDAVYSNTNWGNVSNARFSESDCSYTAVPDANFEAALEALGYDDISDDGQVPTEFIEVITTLDVSSQSISDLTGIEDFTALEWLYVTTNTLTSIDLSNLLNLKRLYAQENSLSSIDLSSNTSLTYITCRDNVITSLDVSNNPDLTNIYFSNNDITSLDVSNNPDLKVISFPNNDLSSLNMRNGNNTIVTNFSITGNSNLTCVEVDDVNYSDTNWTNIDVQTYFIDTGYCVYTAIPDINFESALEALGYDDISGDGQVPTALINTITALDVGNESISDLTGIENFTALEELDADNNTLTSINLSTLLNLKNLNLQVNSLTNIDVSNNLDLEELLVSNNSSLTSLDVSNNTNLKELRANSCSLNSLDVRFNLSLEELRVESNLLTSLDITKNGNLGYITFQYNSITTINLKYNPLLYHLAVTDNGLTSLDISNNPALINIYATNTNISALDLTNNTVLEIASFSNNSALTFVDVRNGNNTNINSFNFTGCAGLTCISVDDAAYSTTNWTNIDVTTSFSETNYCRYTAIPDGVFETKLRGFGLDDSTVNDGQIPTALAEQRTFLFLINEGISDLTGIEDFTALTRLYCRGYGNNITSLDLSSNIHLDILDARYSDLNYLNIRNGNNANMSTFSIRYNDDLTCILVDDEVYSEANWNVDSQAAFTSTDYCGYTLIPDVNFENALEALGYDDISSDGRVPTELIEGIISLDISNNSIVDLTGINDFIALTALDCSNNEIISVDIDNASIITYLNISNNELTTIDAPNNIANLLASYNQITSLDLSQNTSLEALNASSNSLTDLNVQNGFNTNIYDFIISDNNDLTCVLVDNVAYSDTSWVSIDSQTYFSETHCEYTVIPDSNFEAELEALGYDDISGDGKVPTALIEVVTSLDVSNNNISNLTGIEDFVALTSLDASFNSLTSIDVSTCLSLETLQCSDNGTLATLDVSSNILLEKLNCASNSITSLDLSLNTVLKEIVVESNNLSSLNVRNGNNNNVTTYNSLYNTNLTCVFVDDADYSNINWIDRDLSVRYSDTGYCDYITIPDANFEAALNALGYDDISSDGQVPTALIEGVISLDVSSNSISDLSGIEGFIALTSLDCSNNTISSLNLSSLPSLISFTANNNNLISLNAIANTQLTTFIVNDNDLSSLKIKNGTNVNIISINLENNPSLACVLVDNVVYSDTSWVSIDAQTYFIDTGYCSYTTIPDINFETALENLGYDDISGDGQVPTALIEVIASLDVSNNSISDLTGLEDFVALTTLNCSNNLISTLDVNSINNLTSFTANNNSLSSLDLSLMLGLTELILNNNDLSFINIKNGNNSYITSIDLTNNSNLTCVFVDSESYAEPNWLNIDSHTIFRETNYCDYTTIPDVNFENALESLGYDDISSDGQVPTALIEVVTSLDVSNQSISSLTGIQSFTALANLICSNNNLTGLWVSQNPNLISLTAENNQIGSLDLSSNTLLTDLDLFDNNLHSLNVKNGNNLNVISFNTTNNPNLECVLVDDVVYSTSIWTSIDVQTSFNDDYCDNSNIIARYEFINDVDEIINGYDGTYTVSGVDTSVSAATFVSTTNDTGIDCAPFEGIKIPDALIQQLFNDDSFELDLTFTYTAHGADADVSQGDGKKDILFNRSSSQTTSAGFTIISQWYSDTEYLLRFLYSDGQKAEFGSAYGENYIYGPYTIGEEMNLRIIVNHEERQWILFANDDYHTGMFDTYFDMENFKEGILNKTQAAYLGITASPNADKYTGEVIFDEFNVFVPRRSVSINALKSALVYMTNHILGTNILTDADKKGYTAEILQSYSFNYQNAKTEIDNYLTAFEDNFTPLFSTRTKTDIPDLPEEEMLALYLQQEIFDTEFVNGNVDNMAGILFEAHEVYPGPVNAVAPRLSGETIAINATYMLDPGYELTQEKNGVFRPTGYYVPAGELVTVTVPSSLVNNGAEIVVGAHNKDLINDPITSSNINRFPRISKSYEIISEATKIANPFGGAIYIKIAADTNLGWLDITLDDAVKFPYFRMLTGQTTTNITDWQTDVANAYVPWADFESDKMIFTIPTDIIDVTDPTAIMTAWDDMWDNFSLALGRPLEKNRAEFLVIDCGARATSGGYPYEADSDDFTGISRDVWWNPLRVLDSDYLDNFPSTMFHELGHGMGIPKGPGENENDIQLLSVPMVVGLGYTIDEAMMVVEEDGQYLELAAMNWMISYNFRNNLEMRCDPTMNITSSNCRNELIYEMKAGGKWFEIAGLHGWETLGEVHKAYYDLWSTTGTPDNNEITRESYIQNATEATDINLTSILHFWGYIPTDTQITDFDSYYPSSDFCERLDYYRSIIPLTQADYLSWHTELLATTSSWHVDRLTGIYDNYEIEDIPGQILAQIDYLQDLYCDKSLVSPKVYLQGAALNPNSGEEGLMRDNLRVAGLIPTISPYSDALTCESTVFDITDENAIVDWIWLELRDASDNTLVMGSRSALVQRDGDIVDVDGISPVFFNLSNKDYFIAINHRNHLGIISSNTVDLSITTSSIDFTDTNNQITYGTNAQTNFGVPNGIVAMWSGNVNGDTEIKQQGSSNDSNEIKDIVTGEFDNTSSNNLYSFEAYSTGDVNLDGTIKFQGSGNDSSIIKDNIISNPLNIETSNLYIIQQQIPQ